MAVDDDDVITKGAQLGVERFERHHVLGTANCLDMVAVDDPDDVGQFVMGNEEGRFPDAALVELAVGSDAEKPPILAIRAAPSAMPALTESP